MRLHAWLIAICSVLLVSPLARAATNMERQTEFGPVVGVDQGAVSATYAWKGVPFGKAPIGDLRWMAPQDPDPWTLPRPAQQFGNACAQYGRLFGPGLNNKFDATIPTVLNQSVGNEDCLYLNIWRPATSSAGLPVIVFVHGGSNVTGYTADPVYDGANLARAANAVVVTVNYRLGIFGFLSIAQLKAGADAESASGNFALLDIIKSLKFVNHNIAAFGGDPGNVTLMGQSAGAVNVYALMVTPATVNANPKLFHRLAPLSGGISLASDLPPGSFAALATAPQYAGQGAFLLIQRVIDDGLAADIAGANAWIASKTPQEIAAYLRGKTPAEMFFTLLTKLAPIGAAGSGPIPDGTVLPTQPIQAIAAGNYTHVPVLAGQTRDEGKLFPTLLVPNARILTDQQVFNIQFNYQPNAAPQITIGQWITPSYLPANTPVTGYTAKAEALNQAFFIAIAKNTLDTLKTQQNEVWYYRFDWDKEPAPFDEIYGAAHAFDLPFIFGNFGPSLFANVVNTNANLMGRLQLSRGMMVSLGAFARTGNPNVASLGVNWPVWPSKLVFNATLTTRSITVE